MNYKVPFVDFPEQYNRLYSELNAAVSEVFEGGDLVMRRQLAEYEDSLAQFVGVRHAVGTNSGTDALTLSLSAAGIGPGDEVITVAHTFVATLAAIVHNGATPILIDIGSDFNMDVSLLDDAVSPRTKAIVPVHLNGRLCDMDTIMAFAEKNNLVVIEDAAQALGARYNKMLAGSFGLTGCFSFYPAKILGGFGDGGAVVTDDDEVFHRLRLLRDHGQNRETGNIEFYGYNSRLDNLQAALLSVKLRYLPFWIERRREIAMRYNRGLSTIIGVVTPPPPTTSSYYFDVFTNYVIRAERRNELADYLKANRIEALVSWPVPLHHQSALMLECFNLPETDHICGEVISLPIIPELSDSQIDFVIDVICRFYNNSQL
jgi:dTDP-4-amino-4,6-dideoxygalactose transaminase